MVKRHSLPAKGNGKARRLPRATLEALAERRAQGKSPETINHYIRAIRGFTRWLARSDRLRKNPLEGLALLNAEMDIRHARRELTADEIRLFLEGTQKSDRRFRGLNGVDRACLYLAAAATGFRARTLAHLTVADFDLRSDRPVVTHASPVQQVQEVKDSATATGSRGRTGQLPASQAAQQARLGHVMAGQGGRHDSPRPRSRGHSLRRGRHPWARVRRLPRTQAFLPDPVGTLRS